METESPDTTSRVEQPQAIEIDKVAEDRSPANLAAQYKTLKEEHEQIEFLRKLSDSERFAMGLHMMAEAIDAVKAEILREYPDESEEERKLIFVECQYGKELADKVRADLAKRQQKLL